MTTTAYRGVVRGGVVLLDKDTPLAEGTEVLVTAAAYAPGSPAAILAAMESAPQVPAEWVDELERLIAQGGRAPAPPELLVDETPVAGARMSPTDLQQLHQAQSYKKGLLAIYGKWPGDESDEEVERALNELS